MEAEAYGPGPRRVGAFACMAAWGERIWSETAQLRVYDAEKEISRRAAECIVG
jgi:hypothetical protein